MDTETRLKDEQDVPMFEYNSAVQELVKIAKANKKDLDHQILLAKNNLKLLKEEHIRVQGEFNQWKMGEEQKFKNEVAKRNNQLIDQENKMNILYKDVQQRQIDLLVQSERFSKLDEERNAIGNTRIEIEKIRVNAHTLMSEADRKISEANSLMAQANTRITESNRLDAKNATRNHELTAREDKIVFDLRNLDMEKKHLEELRDFVEPKIKEIKLIEDNILEARKQTEIRHQETINKEEENKVVQKALEDKKAKLDVQVREFKSKEEELQRRILIAEARK